MELQLSIVTEKISKVIMIIFIKKKIFDIINNFRIKIFKTFLFLQIQISPLFHGFLGRTTFQKINVIN